MKYTHNVNYFLLEYSRQLSLWNGSIRWTNRKVCTSLTSVECNIEETLTLSLVDNLHHELHYIINQGTTSTRWDTRWRSWLRHCDKVRKVAGSIPDYVIGIFHWHNPSGRIVALGLTQPLMEMSTRNISWGVKATGAYGWQPYHLQVLTVLKSGSLSLLEPSGPVQACNGIALLLLLSLPLPYYFKNRLINNYGKQDSRILWATKGYLLILNRILK